MGVEEVREDGENSKKLELFRLYIKDIVEKFKYKILTNISGVKKVSNREEFIDELKKYGKEIIFFIDRIINETKDLHLEKEKFNVLKQKIKLFKDLEKIIYNGDYYKKGLLIKFLEKNQNFVKDRNYLYAYDLTIKKFFEKNFIDKSGEWYLEKKDIEELLKIIENIEKGIGNLDIKNFKKLEEKNKLIDIKILLDNLLN